MVGTTSPSPSPALAGSNERDLSMSTSELYKTLPLHLKDVQTIDTSALRNLDFASSSKRASLFHNLAWLEDVSIYESGLPKRTADRCPSTHLPQSFIDHMKQFGNIREIRRCEVRGYVKMFTVIELFKKRQRPIRYTFEANEVFGKETLNKISYVSKKEISQFVLKGSHFAAFDFSAWYDQLRYGKGIGEFFCFRKNGKFYALDRLAMGQRKACEIAQSITEAIIDFPGRRCEAHAIVDNMIFVGSYDDVLHDIKIFLERVKRVNATLNEAAEIEKNGLESCIVTSGEWCGLFLDFTAKSVKLTEKTVTKINLSWSNRHRWTWRQFAAHIGLLFYTWGITEVPVHNYYPLLRFVSESSRALQQDDSLWDNKAVIYPSAFSCLEKWTSIASCNEPRLLKASADPSWFVCTDASAWGWGYVALNRQTGEIRCHGQKWSKQQLSSIFSRNGIHKIKKSVYSEPLAVYFSLCHLLKSGSPMKLNFAKEIAQNLRIKINVATDNSATRHTMNRGFASRSFDINQAIKKLKEDFPESEFDIELSFVPGWRNPSDPFSRGKHLQSNGVNTANGQILVDKEKLRRDMEDEILRQQISTCTKRQNPI